MMKKIILIFALLMLSPLLSALTLSGVEIPSSTTVKATSLSLNGAGIRSKFVFDIYVAAFYTVAPVKTLSDIEVKDQPMRMAMHFVYDEVSREKLIDAWDEGFEDNLTEQEYEKLKSRIKLFNSFFVTVKAGDTIYLDFVPGSGTLISINDKNRGKVTGEAFYLALLKIWLGDDPVSSRLKAELLAGGQIAKESGSSDTE